MESCSPRVRRCRHCSLVPCLELEFGASHVVHASWCRQALSSPWSVLDAVCVSKARRVTCFPQQFGDTHTDTHIHIHTPPQHFGRGIVVERVGNPSLARILTAMSCQNKKRTFLFQLTEQERAEADRKVAFSERIPSLAKVSDPIRAEDERNARAALVNIVDALWRRPSLAVPCATWLDARVAAEKKPRGEGFWTNSPGMLRHIEVDWLVNFIVRHSKVTMNTLEKVSVYDPESPFQLLAYALRCNSHLKLPPNMHDKEIMGYMLLHLMEAGGNRLRDLSEKLMVTGGGGGIAWKTVGAYDIKFGDDGLAECVTHRPSQATVVVPGHSPIHASFILEKNWPDYEAAVVKAPSHILLHNLFGPIEGPHALKPLTGAAPLLREAVSSARVKKEHVSEQKAAASGAGTQVGSFKGDHKLELQREAIKKARRVLGEKKMDLQKNARSTWARVPRPPSQLRTALRAQRALAPRGFGRPGVLVGFRRKALGYRWIAPWTGPEHAASGAKEMSSAHAYAWRATRGRSV